MENMIEIEARNIDTAIEKACKEYNLPREKLNIEILSEGSSGFLGLVGIKKARIRASILTFDVESGIVFATNEKQEKVIHVKPAVDSEESDKTFANSQTLLSGVLERMGLDFPVEMHETENAINLTIQGDGSGLLIGKGGQTLDAIQYLINKASNKNGEARKRIIVDTENYRAKREKSLIALAEKLGEKAKKLQRPITVNPMNAHDRRIVHMTLQNDRHLTTKSRGEGNFRKIIIIPTKRSV